MQKILRGLFFGFVAVFLLIVFAKSQVQATDSDSAPGKLQKELRQDQKKLAVVSPKKATRASEFAQKACETHVRVIQKRQDNIVAHSERTQARLAKLTAAVQEFYENRLVSQGKVVPNYDALVADVSSKQAAITPLIEKIEADSGGLTCDKDQAGGQFGAFRSDMQKLIKGFKDYRLSILNLMQAIKKAANTNEDKEASASAQ